MISSNNKWLIHTLLIGLIPVFTRLLVWASSTTGTVTPLATADFTALGLVVHVSILNEMGYLRISDPAVKALLNALSILFITCYGTLYALTALSERNTELIDTQIILPIGMALSLLSAMFGLILFHHSNRSPL